MLWRWARGETGLEIVSGTVAERNAAIREIARLQGVGQDGFTTGSRLAEALRSGTFPWEVLKSLSSWCNTEGRFQAGVDPARCLSLVLFNRRLPRLTTFRSIRVTDQDARAAFAAFATEAGIWEVDAQVAESQVESARAITNDEGKPFPILGTAGERIRTLDEWLRWAPPARGTAHWRDGRSAKELARRWLPGVIPSEIRALLDSRTEFHGFRARSALAETQTPFDEFGGNTRNHDLVVIGVSRGARVLLDLEGKADEPCGDTILAALAAADQRRRKNPASRGRERIVRLCQAIFGAAPEEVDDLRYQLLFGVAATLIRARCERATIAVFLAHEFLTPVLSPNNLLRNQADLTHFVSCLGGGRVLPTTELVGPLFVPGNDRIPAGLPLYVGKATCRIDPELL